MRVVAGRFRGRTLEAPAGETTRPITDRAKETLFNVLGNKFGTLGELPDIDVLDVFAGTGSLGIESLSRGARACTFVERHRAALSALRSNLASLKLPATAATVAVVDAWKLSGEALGRSRFGLVFLDPPYRDVADQRRIVELLGRLIECVAPGGLIVFRSPAAVRLTASQLPPVEATDEREIGSMRILILSKAGASGIGLGGYDGLNPSAKGTSDDAE